MEYNTNFFSINNLQSELFMKYKSSFKSAFLDLSIHSIFTSSAFYLMSYFNDSWISFFTIPLMSLLNIKTFIIFHDCCHNSYTPNKTLNYIISHITGTIKFTSPLWGLDHNIHHLTSGNKNNKFNYKYNELIDYTEDEYINISYCNKFVYNIFYNYKVYFTLFPFLYFFILQRFIYIIKKLKYKNKILESFTYILLNHLINNISIGIFIFYLSKYKIIFHYLISLYISFILGFILFHNQHTFNPSYVVDNKKWNVIDSGLLGSSFIQIPYYLKYFSGGIEYHHIHHITD